MSHGNGQGRVDDHSPSTQTAWLRSVFERHDLNQDGRLTLGEFIRLAKWLDGTLTTEDCEADFARMDAGMCGTVEFDALARWWDDRTATGAATPM